MIAVFTILSFITINFSSVFTLKINLGGEWLLKAANGNYNNLTAIVPGGIYTDLMNNKIIGDVFYGYNDTETRWVSKTPWIYYRNFTVDEEFVENSNINLVFEGLDTFATIFINDIQVGKAENMFVRCVFNIKKEIKPGENSIEVQFSSAVDEAKKLADEQAKNYVVPPNCPPNEYQGECHINQIRKMQASFSWDWGPALPSVGIWKDLYLEAFNSSVIRYVVASTLEFPDNWLLNISIYFDSGTGKRTAGKIIYKLPLEMAVIEEIVDIDVVPNEYNETVKVYSFTVIKANVRKWWPNGYGDQKLYSLTIQFLNNTEISEKTIKIGFRKIELIQNQLAKGLTFFFKINDIPIFMKGANQIPLDILPEKGQNPKTILNILKSAQEANMNMIRVWGGGVYESDYFYNTADELGILIWQDFMFACALYPTRPEFLRNVLEEVRHQVKRLNSHPSIALWAGNNENEVALMTNWYNTKDNLTLYKEDYIKLYIETIKKELNRISNDTIFVSSSPTNGKQSEKENYLSTDPQNSLYGDVHYYNYLLNSLEVTTYPVPRFASEYGYQSLPDVSTWLTVTNNISDINPGSSFMDHRQHHPGGLLENSLLIGYQLSLPNSTSKNYYKAYIFYSQIIQALSIKFETEFYRSFIGRFDEKGQGNTMGALFWQLNDVWVAPTWSGIGTIDWPYFAKDFFYPAIITGFLDIQRQLRVYVISDVPVHINTILPVDVIIEVYNWSSFQPLNSTKINCTLEYGKALEVIALNTDDFLVDVGCGLLLEAKYNCFFHLILNSQGVLVAPDNVVFPGKIKYSNIQQASVEIGGVRKIDDIGKKFELILTTDKIALFVWLDSQQISGRFSENGFIQISPDKTIYFMSDEVTTTVKLESVLKVTHLNDLQYII